MKKWLSTIIAILCLGNIVLYWGNIEAVMGWVVALAGWVEVAFNVLNKVDSIPGCTGDCNQGRLPCNCPAGNKNG